VLLLGEARPFLLGLVDEAAEALGAPQDRRSLGRALRRPVRAERQQDAGDDERDAEQRGVREDDQQRQESGAGDEHERTEATPLHPGRRGQPHEPALRLRVLDERALDLLHLAVERVPEVGELDLVPVLEQRVQQLALVVLERGVGLLLLRELPVRLVQEPALAGDLLDDEVAAHGEVDDRGGHVERVGREVDERAELSGPQVVGRDELDRGLLVMEERDVLFGAAVATECLIDRRAAVAAGAAGPVPEGSEQHVPGERGARGGAPPRPAVTGVTEKALARLNPSSRMGSGGGTAPLGIATTTVMAALGGMAFWVKVAVGPLLVALVQGSVDRSGPLKHATWVMSA